MLISGIKGKGVYMKKFFLMILIVGVSLFACTPAEKLIQAKENESATVGIPREFSIISAYTGTTVWQRYIENSYFTNDSNIETTILDLEKKDKISVIMTTGFLLIVEEKSRK
jgi:hypothetical protein